MYRKITTSLATALVLPLTVGALTAATPALARAHRHHHVAPAATYGAAITDHAQYRPSDDVPFAPF